MTEDRRNNPASRLYDTFVLANRSSNVGNARQVWGQVFGIDVRNDLKPALLIELLERLLAVAAEIDAVRQYARATNKPSRLWEPHLSSLDRALSLQTLEVGYSGLAPTAEPLNTLLWFAEEMPDEGELDRTLGERDAMLDDLGTFWTNIRNSRLPDRVKLEIIDLLRQIETAIRNVDVAGPIPVYRAARKAERALGDFTPLLTDDQAAVSGFKHWLAQMKPGARYFAAIARTGADVAKLIESTKDLLRLGPGDLQ